MSYTINCYRDRGGGLHEAVGSHETLGESYGTTYETLEAATDARDDLEATWEDAWGMGPCPTYVVLRDGWEVLPC